MHYFEIKKIRNFPGRGYSTITRPLSQWEGGHPLPTKIPPWRLRRLNSRAFTALNSHCFSTNRTLRPITTTSSHRILSMLEKLQANFCFLLVNSVAIIAIKHIDTKTDIFVGFYILVILICLHFSLRLNMSSFTFYKFTSTRSLTLPSCTRR